MGLSLGLLGRGDARAAWRYGLWHVLAAGVGGAVVGGVLGGVGEVFGLGRWGLWIVGAVAALSLAVALCRRTYQLGRQRQVPRRWPRGTTPARIYGVWGLMMGCGLYTPVYHTALLVLLAVQLVSGFWLGLATGFAFGIVRQAASLWPVARRYDPERTMGLLESLRPGARAFNIALVASALAAVVLGLLGLG
jgi:hypothetical protein